MLHWVNISVIVSWALIHLLFEDGGKNGFIWILIEETYFWMSLFPVMWFQPECTVSWWPYECVVTYLEIKGSVSLSKFSVKPVAVQQQQIQNNSRNLLKMTIYMLFCSDVPLWRKSVRLHVQFSQITAIVPLCYSIRQLPLSEYTCLWENRITACRMSSPVR